MEKCSQCEKNAIQKYGENNLCLDCLERLSNIHHRENEQRHREMMYNMQLSNAAERNMYEQVGLSNKPLSFDLSVFNPSRNIKVSNVNLNNSVVGNISTEEVGNIQVSLNKINSTGNQSVAANLHEFTESVLANSEIDTSKKNEILEQVSLLSEQIALPPQNRKIGLIKAGYAALKESISLVSSLADAWVKIEPIIKQLIH